MSNDDTQVKCLAHGNKVVVPCELRACPLNIEHEEYNNCVLGYVSLKGKSDLELVDISILYKKSISYLSNTLGEAMKSIRVQSADVDRRLHFNPDLEWVSNDLRTERAYESDNIPMDVSHLVEKIETRFQIPTQDVLRWGSQQYESDSLLSDALDLTSGEFSKLKNTIGVNEDD